MNALIDNLKGSHYGKVFFFDSFSFPPLFSLSSPSLPLPSHTPPPQIWIDIENYQWSSSLSANQNFITQLIQTGEKRNAKMGVYSSYYNWQSIVGLRFVVVIIRFISIMIVIISIISISIIIRVVVLLLLFYLVLSAIQNFISLLFVFVILYENSSPFCLLFYFVLFYFVLFYFVLFYFILF